MARPARKSPSGPRTVLSAESLLRTSSLQPIIASRSNGSRDLQDPPRRGNVRRNLSTPRNMYDNDDSSISGPDSYQNPQGRGYFNPTNTRDRRFEVSSADSSLVDYQPHRSMPLEDMYAYDRHMDSKPPRPPMPHNGVNMYHPYQGRRRRRRDQREDSSRSGVHGCYVFLKLLEMMTCIAIVVVSRLWTSDLELHVVYTCLAAIGLIIAVLGLFFIWIKGHPSSGECYHIVMLLCYIITIPVLMTGGIMVLLQEDFTVYAYTVTGLFFFAGLLFTIDMIVMILAILQCGLYCYKPSHPKRRHRTYPRPNRVQHERYPPRYPRDNRSHPDTGYYTNPKSVPQMDVRS